MSTKPTGVIIGLTGGIATGKSTVSKIFQELDVPVFDADELARNVVAPGSEGLQAVIGRFGDSLLTTDGQLDRKALATRIFQDSQARKDLEAITHPRIAMALMKQAREAFSRQHPWVLYDAALLIETGSHKLFPRIIVVDAPREVQELRLKARDGLTEPEIAQRLQAQAPRNEKLAIADYVIDNSKSLEATRQQVHAVKEELDRLYPPSDVRDHQ